MTEQVTEETVEQVSTTGQVANDLAREPNGSPETPQGEAAAPGGDSTKSTEEEPETFPRKVVEDLRRENATYRTRAQRADDLAARLHTALVAATGRLADPSDLPFDEGHLDDENALSTAIDDLLSRKPHLASRRPAGDVGQGATPSGEAVDLAGILRARAS